MTDSPPLPRRKYTATLGGMASYIDGTTLVSLGTAVVLFRDQLHISAWGIGALVAALQLSFATGAVIGGRLGDLFGRRAVYSVDLLVYAAGALIIVLSPNQATLFTGVIVTGLAMGADVPTSLALVFEEADDGQGGSAVAYCQTLLLAGVVVTQIIGFVVADMGALGARLLFVHPLVVAIVVWILRRKVDESAAWEKACALPRAAERRNLKAVFSQTSGVAMVATALFYVATAMTPNTVGQFSTYLITTLSHSTTRTATVVGLLGVLVSVAAALLFQRLVDTPGRGAVFALGLVTLVLGPLVCVIAGFSLWSVVVMMVIISIGSPCAGEGIYKVWTQEIFPTEIRGTAQGLTYGVARFATAGFSLLTPALATGSPTTLMLVLSGLSVLAAAVGLLWIPRLTRHGDSGSGAEAATLSAATPPLEKA
ncbi:MFS transporter [Streptomyces sp. cg40]|uniref:MFS transporter n=1 Tax=Streptomyces sp. cg40 TaxID=3419764 RepID=UPI003CFE26B9